MARIHHNTVKKAQSYGIVLKLSDVDGAVQAYDKSGKMLAEHLMGTTALQLAIDKLGAQTKPLGKKDVRGGKKSTKARAKVRARQDDEEGDEDAEIEEEQLEDGDEDEGRSIVKKKYKTRYRPFKMTCGDDLAQLISQHIKVQDEEAGELRIDEAKLKRFAQANGCWDSKYAHLNVGMRRMNVANRLRAKVRKGHEVVWAS